MQSTAHAVHAIQAPRRGRARWLFLAVLLQVGFVYALVEGLDIKVGPIAIPPPIIATIDRGHKPPPLPPPRGTMVEPNVEKPIAPTIIIDTGDQPSHGITLNAGNHTTGPADHGPITIAATHTIPPYPPLDVRLGHEGTVVLRLTIGPDGRVTDAVVVKTSGYDTLDAAARIWVLAHWRYQPAVRGGAAIPGTATVGVQFNLRNTG
jgi:periplasmic protein TonB